MSSSREFLDCEKDCIMGRGYTNPKDVSHAYPVQGSSTSAPPVNYSQQKREGPALAGQAASNQIASGLDALNLNQKNPELLSGKLIMMMILYRSFIQPHGQLFSTHYQQAAELLNSGLSRD
uniref:Uncharacterized protein n=1 Tax=Heterorhabditis bacteriophora TaxID=37862 RepID=A0A1I7WZU7_HETBA